MGVSSMKPITKYVSILFEVRYKPKKKSLFNNFYEGESCEIRKVHKYFFFIADAKGGLNTSFVPYPLRGQTQPIKSFFEI